MIFPLVPLTFFIWGKAPIKMRCMDRHHKGDNRRGLVILKRLMQGEYEDSKGLARMETETLQRSGGGEGGLTLKRRTLW